MIKAFIYFFLTSVSALGDNIFLYFVSLMLLQLENGGLLSAIVLGMDAFFEILIGPQLAKFTDAIPELYKRLRFARLVYILSMPLAILPFIKFNPTFGGIIWLIIAVGVIRMLLLFDQQLQSAIPLHLEKKEKLPLARSISFFTFTQRSIPLLSSSLATLLLGSSLFFVSSLNSISYLLGILGLVFILQCSGIPKKKEESLPESSVESPIAMSAHQKEWTFWYCVLQFLTCLAFGSVVLILNKSILSFKDFTPFEQMLYGPGSMYAGMLLALVFITIYPSKSQWFSEGGKNVCYLPLALGLAVVLTALTHFYLQVFFLFVTGIINGFSLVALNTFSQRKFEGKNFVSALAKSQAARKSGMLLSLVIAGICIDLGINTNLLLIGFGFLGTLVSAFMLVRAASLEQALTQSSVMQES